MTCHGRQNQKFLTKKNNRQNLENRSIDILIVDWSILFLIKMAQAQIDTLRAEIATLNDEKNELIGLLAPGLSARMVIAIHNRIAAKDNIIAAKDNIIAALEAQITVLLQQAGNRILSNDLLHQPINYANVFFAGKEDLKIISSYLSSLCCCLCSFLEASVSVKQRHLGGSTPQQFSVSKTPLLSSSHSAIKED
jgi:hypothetical protein